MILHLDGDELIALPLRERKYRLAGLLAGAGAPLQYSDHQTGRGPAFHAKACEMKLEGIVSKRADAPYIPGNRGLWQKMRCVNREEFVVVGWTDPEGARPWLGALLLAYYDPDGRLVYAGRAGIGLDAAELNRLWRRLQPLAVEKPPLDVLPPRTSRFGSPLVLSRVHWVRPELVVEVTYLTGTAENLLRQVVYQGVREDKRARGMPAGAAGDGRGSAAALAVAAKEPAGAAREHAFRAAHQVLSSRRLVPGPPVSWRRFVFSHGEYPAGDLGQIAAAPAGATKAAANPASRKWTATASFTTPRRPAGVISHPSAPQFSPSRACMPSRR